MPITTTYHNDFIVDAAKKKLHQVTFTLVPADWKAYPSTITLKWKLVAFDEKNHSKIPKKSGVYTFVIVPGVARHPRNSLPIYVGEAKDLNNRYKNYLDDRTNAKARPLVKAMFALWYDYLVYCYAEIDDSSLVHGVQDDLIRALSPVINSMYPKDVQATVTAAAL